MNRVILIGRLTRDPELRYTPNGTAVCSFTLAVSRRYKRDEADFIPVITWMKLAEHCANYLGKGRMVAVDGRLQVRSYQAQDGQKKWITEVIGEDVQFLDRGGTSSHFQSMQTSKSSGEDWSDLGREIIVDDIDIVDRDDDDDIPF
ncbi:MAG: single-stranded DNA-binding protein [Syntrophomonadaceae bacterium]